MRIACPGCAAEYEVPSANLPPQRKVRCARCSAEWLPVQEAPIVSPDQEAAAAAEEAEPEPEPTETAMDRLAAAAPKRSSGRLRAAWIVTVLVLLGSAAAAMTWRDQVTRAWPPSAWILGMVDHVVADTVPPRQASVKTDKSPN